MCCFAYLLAEVLGAVVVRRSCNIWDLAMKTPDRLRDIDSTPKPTHRSRCDRSFRPTLRTSRRAQRTAAVRFCARIQRY